MKLNFSCHAILRYLERFRGIRINDIRQEDEGDAALITRLSLEYKLNKTAIEKEVCPMSDANKISLNLGQGSRFVRVVSALGETVKLHIEWSPRKTHTPLVTTVTPDMSQRRKGVSDQWSSMHKRVR